MGRGNLPDGADWQACFRKIHKELGVRGGSKFYDRLGAKLRALWHVTEDMRYDDEAIYEAVAPKIRDLIQHFIPEPGTPNSLALLQQSLRLSYNVADDAEYKGYKNRYLGVRQTALDRGGDAHDSIAKSTAAKQVRLAIPQFIPIVEAQLIAAGIVPNLHASNAQDHSEVKEQQESATDNPPRSIAEPTTTSRRSRRSRVLFLAATTAVVVAALAASWLLFDRPSSNPPAFQSLPVSSSAEALPLKIEDVALDSGSDRSVVLADALNLNGEQLRALGYYVSYDEFTVLDKAVSIGPGTVRITFANALNEPVSITDITAGSGCAAPLRGTLFYSGDRSPSQDFSGDQVGFNLDLPQPYAQVVQNGRLLPESYFAEHGPMVVEPHAGPQTLSVFVTTVNYCNFGFHLVVADAQGTTREAINYQTNHLALNNPLAVGIATSPGGLPLAITAIPHASNPAGIDFSYYQAVYAGGQLASPPITGFVKVNPKTYPGVGNPASYPPVG